MRDKRANITVVTYNRLELTHRCLMSLLKLTAGNFFVNVVDNFSNDGTWEFLSHLKDIDKRVRCFRLAWNMGVAPAANYGWYTDEDSYYVKLDNDVEILHGDWLSILMDYIDKNPEIGAIGYKFLTKHSAKPTILNSGDLLWEFDTCGGACVMIPPHVHACLGFWNEDYGKYGFEDMEYSLRCRLHGFKTGYVPFEDKVRHMGYESMENNYENDKRKQLTNKLVGEKMYFLNKMLFEEGIRPLKIIRRFLPIPGSNPVKFKSNPEYTKILKLHNTMQKSIDFQRVGQHVQLDLSRWKKQNTL